MAFVLIIIGVVLLISSVKNTVTSTPTGGPGLFTLVQGDFSGPNNFVFWMVSILLIGALGYIPKLKPLSVAFLTLVVTVLFLTKGNPSSTGGGFFSQFANALNSTTAPQPTTGGNPLNILGSTPSPLSPVDMGSNLPIPVSGLTTPPFVSSPAPDAPSIGAFGLGSGVPGV